MGSCPNDESTGVKVSIPSTCLLPRHKVEKFPRHSHSRGFPLPFIFPQGQERTMMVGSAHTTSGMIFTSSLPVIFSSGNLKQECDFLLDLIVEKPSPSRSFGAFDIYPTRWWLLEFISSLNHAWCQTLPISSRLLIFIVRFLVCCFFTTFVRYGGKFLIYLGCTSSSPLGGIVSFFPFLHGAVKGRMGSSLFASEIPLLLPRGWDHYFVERVGWPPSRVGESLGVSRVVQSWGQSFGERTCFWAF